MARHPVRHHLQPPPGRRERPHLLHPPAVPRHPHRRRHLGLADIHPRHPLGEQRLIFDNIHLALLLSVPVRHAAAVRGSAGRKPQIWSAGSKHQSPALHQAPSVRLLSGVTPAKRRRRQRTAAAPSNKPPPDHPSAKRPDSPARHLHRRTSAGQPARMVAVGSWRLMTSVARGCRGTVAARTIPEQTRAGLNTVHTACWLGPATSSRSSWRRP